MSDPAALVQSSTQTIHATAVALTLADGRVAAVLLRGVSGSGKSDLALRLAHAGGQLVADDQTVLSRAGDDLVCAAPPALAGLLEVRGLGLVRVTALPAASVALVVDLVPRADVPRLSEPAYVRLLDKDIPCLRLHAFDAATPAKIHLALAVVDDPEKVIR